MKDSLKMVMPNALKGGGGGGVGGDGKWQGRKSLIGDS